MWVSPAIFDALTWIDADGALHPALAMSWQMSDDGRTWIFKLRPNVTYSNGRPFDAAAVVALLDNLARTAGPNHLNALEFADVAGAQAIDPLTLEIVSRHPEHLFDRDGAARLARPFGEIL